jgi:hypothetical protein
MDQQEGGLSCHDGGEEICPTTHLPIQIPAGFDRWNKASGQVLDVLVERREAEREEFYSSLQVGPPLNG